MSRAIPRTYWVAGAAVLLALLFAAAATVAPPNGGCAAPPAPAPRTPGVHAPAAGFARAHAGH
ncbi:DUF305 domain-containing protein, partial [Streptomyces yangpuensis]